MKRFLFLIPMLMIMTVTAHSQQTIIPAGNVSGTWTAAGSPYLIQGSITVPANSTLNIEPGVEVNFLGNYFLTVNGFLQALGTVTDSIHFKSSTGYWGGIIFSDAPDSSHLNYCILDSMNCVLAPVVSVNSNPVISHCTIMHNNGMLDCGGISLKNNSNARIMYCTISYNHGNNTYGGGIIIEDSNPEIFQCSIIGNSCATGYGGGIYIAGGNPLISQSTIAENNANHGSGLYVDTGGSLILRSSTLSHNHGNQQGGGIVISSSTGVINLDKCMVIANTSATGGSGIHIVDADSVVITASLFESNSNGNQEGAIYSANCTRLIIDHCDFVKNMIFDTFMASGGITLNGNTNLTLRNSIFKGQAGSNIDFRSYLSASVSYCDFEFGYEPFNFPPSGLGAITTVNANGDPCDVFYNIYLDPLFVDYTLGDYHLTENSPCIDAGDPSMPNDPDGTVNDMGGFYFHQDIPTWIERDASKITEGYTLYQAYPNPFNSVTTINFDLPEISNATLFIYNGSGKIVFEKIYGKLDPGRYEYIWDAFNMSGGVYFYRLRTDKSDITKKMILLK